tara:strand:+ start:5 stop:481 length:477 start_codon:yes stop_codon:yes gene_type:complete
MSKYSSGRYAKRISDRSGLAFPYNEMVEEWNGSRVHISEYEEKHPQLDPKYHPTDPQSLQYAKPQTAVSRVFVGGATGPINAGTIVVKPDGSDAAYNGPGFGLNVNSFETADQVVTHTRADGSTFTITTKSMMPLELQAPNKPTRLLSSVGNVTVSTS